MKLVNDEALSYLVVPNSKMLSQYHYSKKVIITYITQNTCFKSNTFGYLITLRIS